MSRKITPVAIAPEDRIRLEKLVRAPTTPQRLARRAKVVLMLAEAVSEAAVGAELGLSRQSVGLWKARFCEAGIDGLNDAKGRGRKASVPDSVRERVITEAVRAPAGTPRWSTRKMARHAGTSPATVGRIWRDNDIKPHLTRTFKLSRDPRFEEKFWDIVGLYLDPPEKTLVLCCDEKTQCQALERTQPGLPLGVGHIRTKTHDYTRHGTTTLFAALNYLDGKIHATTAARHRHQEWLKFLKRLDAETPKGVQLHLIMDNYGSHKHEKIMKWLAKKPRIHLHFTPTGSSWLNLVERFFRDITTEVVRDGSFTSVGELTGAIMGYIDGRNLAPKRYVWRKSGEEILRKIASARAAQAETNG
jgi:transposase